MSGIFVLKQCISYKKALIGLSKIGIQSQLLDKVKILVTNSDMVLIIQGVPEKTTFKDF